ncbi:MAG TPA: hypothetical protein VKT80_20125 [Chloroflexota bacterium]|nr:hypothetical protein [Chloroflexota bacterium]
MADGSGSGSAALNASLSSGTSDRTASGSLGSSSTKGSGAALELLSGAAGETSGDLGAGRWTDLDRASVIDPALFKSNMGISIGTSIVTGDASLVLVQTPASDKRMTEIRCRSDLT